MNPELLKIIAQAVIITLVIMVGVYARFGNGLATRIFLALTMTASVIGVLASLGAGKNVMSVENLVAIPLGVAISVSRHVALSSGSGDPSRARHRASGKHGSTRARPPRRRLPRQRNRRPWWQRSVPPFRRFKLRVFRRRRRKGGAHRRDRGFMSESGRSRRSG